MDFGSSHVYEYADSGEEYISDEEYEVGMFLSDEDSDDDDELPQLTGAQEYKLALPVTTNSQVTSNTSSYLLGEVSNVSSAAMQPIIVPESARLPPPPPPHARLPPPPPPHARLPPPPPPHARLPPPPQPRPFPVGKPKSSPPTAGYESAIHIQPESKLLAPPPPPPPAGSSRTTPAYAAVQPYQLKKRTNWLKKGGVKGRTTRQADTNVIAVKFNTLTEPSHMHTGDAVVCSNKDCTAILSHLSKLKQNTETGAKTWHCEFCGAVNAAELEPEEVPTKDDTTFMIAPAPVNSQQGATGGMESLIIFCVDISGSMCVTTEVSGKFQLKGHSRVAGLQNFNVDGENQYMRGQKRDVTYVSRLQSVQAAVDHQLGEFAKSQPHTKISLITFNNEVTVFGDGKNDAVVVTGDKLNNNDALVKVGTEASLPASIKETQKSLSSKLFSLEESGSTALGPALIISITMAARVPGSRVVVCTDGLANVGLGSLDELHTDKQVKEGQKFYEKLGAQAVDKGVIVSVVSIKGTDCRIIELGQVANQTGGEVTIVDPLTLKQQFSTILANPIIATNVVTKLILHKGLYFRHEDSQSTSCVTIQVGNVTADTELTYEYGIRSKKSKEKDNDKCDTAAQTEVDDKELTPGGAVGGAGATAAAAETKDTPPLLIDGMECLPFQLQISYNNLEGAQCNRVITQSKPITKDRQVAEAGSNVQVLGVHVAKTTARMALEGEYTKARTKALVNQRLVQRVGHIYDRQDEYRAWVKNVAPMENVMRESQKKERLTFGRSHSDDDDDDYNLGPKTVVRSSLPQVAKKKAYKRRGESSDAVSEVYYKNMWPYCAQLCSYCNFNKYVRAVIDHDLMEKVLIKELGTFIKMSGFDTVTSIYFGGGTPSLAKPATIEAVIDEVAKLCHLPTNAEIDLEANPSSASESILRDFQQAGINRLSLGIQALSDQDLKVLNRDHNTKEAMRQYAWARYACMLASIQMDWEFKTKDGSLSVCKELFPGRTNIDIIFGRPGQTMIDWKAELNKVLEVCDSHISLYQLTVEQGTPLAKEIQHNRVKLPDAECMADMYEYAVERLSEAGLHQYEISNFARSGAESQHNYSYWKGEQYIGIGPGAHSRFSLKDHFQVIARVQAPVPDMWTKLVLTEGHGTQKATVLSTRKRFEEVVMTSLRTIHGLTNEVWRNLGLSGTVYSCLSTLDCVQELMMSNLIVLDSKGLRATTKGLAVTDSLITELLTDKLNFIA